MFEIQKTASFNKNKLTPIVDDKQYAYVTRTSQNNGILQYSGFVNENNINSANTYSLGLLQMNFFFQQTPWYAGQFVRKIIPKFPINNLLANYFGTILNKQSSKLLSVLVREIDEVFRNIEILLPTHTNGEIAFDYMEDYIKELEAERIKELESYLVATGLNDYILTDDEEKLINNFRNDNIIWGEFRIDELFKVQTSRKRFDANKVTIQKNGSPYVVRTSLNNGTRGLINEDQKYLNEANAISFGQGTATMFYQKKPYFTGDKIKVLIPKFKGFNEIIAQFLITSMTKSFSTFTWGSSSYNVKIINSQKIKVLTNSNGEPDYDKMILLIKSFEKLVIKGVVKWKDKQIEATRKIVSKNDIN